MKKNMLIEIAIMGVVMVLVIGVGAILVSGMVTKKIITGTDSDTKTDTGGYGGNTQTGSAGYAPENTEAANTEPKTEENLADEDGNIPKGNCTNKGGRLASKRTAKGEEYWVCLFEDNRQCEVEAMLSGKCPTGGRKITGYNGDEILIYCAIHGNEPDMDNNTCTMESGVVCDADDYYNGECKN